MKGLIARNSLVKQAIAQIEQRLRAGVREPYQKIVVAGSKAALEGGVNGILAQLKNSKDVLHDAVDGAIGLVGALRRAAKGAMPVDAMVPAGLVLALEALDFAEHLGMITVTKDVIAEATKLYINTLLPRLGMTPDKLASIATRVQGVMSNPDKMAKVYGIGRQPPQQPPQPGAQ